MLIQPIEPVAVTIKMGQNSYECQMVSLSESELALKSYDYFEKGSEVLFFAKYFRGHAVVCTIEFSDYCFTYKMEIVRIQFQPGLLINTRL
ncbi:TPA: hypothetical protein I9781_001453 [Legionella pneumophila]|uniref:Uncharacterized protein n=2 Tax=Legionella pneumophila TaxID=446 RepID=A0AAN5Q5T0_LEGPN|nr:hypothetical protein [Legionella pneumophila]AOW53368.1 hypothetical protein BE841_13330 [Legionella pneumophila subsp. pneumophila]AOW55735.1 hypothetical protein BE842_10305 [Legionella pneumophila subsp. pneumophila]AOW58703.1 hypothetical protein BE843_10780 [Legionella pneumophila subsp. pneumophila]AOW61110.1 hypothetical protein BE844_07985 [Legionella pneumophila subsp. pneumophila]AOW64166.1 hypothetical protein BE845_08905 [Legionella pneumophila subsp. pneumophila]